MKIFKPPEFKAKDKSQEISFIKENSFATIISTKDNSPVSISKTPLILKIKDDTLYLEGHLAKANPHIDFLKENPRVTLIFDGPHGYISPTWYESPSKNVPTWNYSSVFAKGAVDLIDSSNWLLKSVLELSDTYEKDSNWKESVDKKYLDSLLKGILGLRIKIDFIESKFKLSQNKSNNERSLLIQNLNSSPLAQLMEKI